MGCEYCGCDCYDDDYEPYDGKNAVRYHDHPIAKGKSGLALTGEVTVLDLSSHDPEDLIGLPAREG